MLMNFSAWSFIAHGLNVMECAQRWLGVRRLKHLVSMRLELRDEFAHVKKDLKLSSAIKTDGETETNRFGPLQLLSDAVCFFCGTVCFCLLLFVFVFEFDVFGEHGVYGREVVL